MSQLMTYLKVLRMLHTHVCKIRWKIEEFHREIKQLTGIESCQCRKVMPPARYRERLQRNHIACAMLVWLRLKNLAYKTGQTVYQIKHNLLSNYLTPATKTSRDFYVYSIVFGRLVRFAHHCLCQLRKS